MKYVKHITIQKLPAQKTGINKMGNYKMSKILITGCAGFIGNRTCELLLDSGIEIIGIDNMDESSYPAKTKYQRLVNLAMKHHGFEFHKVNIMDKKYIFKLIKDRNIDTVIHLAALAGVRASIENPYNFIDINVKGTLNLLEACVNNNVKKFVVASSSSVYGEEQRASSIENMPTDYPVSIYGATKKAIEVLCYSYNNIYGLDISVLRFFTCYGEKGRPDMSIFKFIEGIKNETEITVFGDGAQKRDFTYVGDTAEGIIKSLKPMGYEIINLGNNNPVTINYIISLIEQNLNKKAKIKYLPRNKADVLINFANIEKAKSLLDWEPKVKIEEGIKRTINWHVGKK